MSGKLTPTAPDVKYSTMFKCHSCMDTRGGHSFIGLLGSSKIWKYRNFLISGNRPRCRSVSTPTSPVRYRLVWLSSRLVARDGTGSVALLAVSRVYSLACRCASSLLRVRLSTSLEETEHMLTLSPAVKVRPYQLRWNALAIDSRSIVIVPWRMGSTSATGMACTRARTAFSGRVPCPGTGHSSG